MNRFLAAAQDNGMTDGDYAFFVFTDYITNYTLQPWTVLIVNSSEDFEHRKQAFCSLKQVVFILLTVTKIIIIYVLTTR